MWGYYLDELDWGDKMIIPRFLLKHTITKFDCEGVNGRGEKITIEKWTKRCHVSTQEVKMKNKDNTYTQEKKYTITIEKCDIEIGDILKYKGIDIEVVDIPDSNVHSGGKYMEVIGYGQKI